jgi:hypothetical protein
VPFRVIYVHAERQGQEKQRKAQEDKTMSKAQGDGFRTWTNAALNNYREALRQKILKLEDRKEKWFRVGNGWIQTEEKNRMVNPGGSWKWHGWQAEAHEYWVTVYPGENVEIKDGKPRRM